jgi:hypothetical protein
VTLERNYEFRRHSQRGGASEKESHDDDNDDDDDDNDAQEKLLSIDMPACSMMIP